jgi:cell division septal protein FtsQ
MKKQRFAVAVKPLAGLVVITLILCFAVILLGRAAKDSALFRIRQIVIKEEGASGNNIDLSFFLGRNIIAVDLGEEECNIAKIYPGYKEIKLVRIFPDRLFAYFIRRRPIACVKLSRSFYVDADAVLFDLPAAEAGRLPEFPVIWGLETKIFGPQVGRRYNLNELQLALDIIKVVKNNYQLRGLKINKIDVSSAASASLTISLPVVPQVRPGVPGSIEIKIGQEYIADKINILASLLIQARNDWKNIKYIDLRFKEPVIKFNDKEK